MVCFTAAALSTLCRSANKPTWSAILQQHTHTSCRRAMTATGSVALSMAPNSRLCTQLQSYGKTYLTNTAVRAVPITTPGPASSSTCRQARCEANRHCCRRCLWASMSWPFCCTNRAVIQQMWLGTPRQRPRERVATEDVCITHLSQVTVTAGNQKVTKK